MVIAPFSIFELSLFSATVLTAALQIGRSADRSSVHTGEHQTLVAVVAGNTAGWLPAAAGIGTVDWLPVADIDTAD